VPLSRADACDARPPIGRRVALALGDIKLAHSVFALPFAVLGAALVAPRDAGGSILWRDLSVMLALVGACMVFARTWAMLVNRVADARLDAANPRTRGRALARGALSRRDAAPILGACALAFVACTAFFGVLFANWWPLALSVPVLAWIGFYSFTKRFTFLCHLFLGGALAASPLAAAIAVDPGALAHAPGVFWIGAMVLCWVAGFDVIYALQDLEHDRGAGLHSIPSRFGWRGAVFASRVLHLGALGALGAAWVASDRLGVLFGIGVLLTASLLGVEHAVVSRRGARGIPVAFFTLNGVISLVLGALGTLDALLE